MQSFTFTNLLEESSSVIDLARRLGAVCMEQAAELLVELEAELLRELADSITSHVETSEGAAWAAVVRDPRRVRSQLGQDLTVLLEKADSYYPLDCLGVLRGFCRGALPTFFAATEGVVPLDRGMPVPFAFRPLGKGFEKTPHPERLHLNELLGGYAHRLFEYPEGDTSRVVLDFSVRARVDELTWSGKQKLPRVATIHPERCGSLRIGMRTEREFFDATPLEWRKEEVLDLLRQVADVEIAVLPELSLPNPAALEQELAGSPEEFPPLVVAGSAHVREEGGDRPVRANETRIYLDGQLVGQHRKCHPYIATALEGEKLLVPLAEGITRERKTITVLAGRHSRLAVVICADLNDQYIPQKLLAAGVSTLLVPSFTPKQGAFNGPIADLAARCQGVSVIVNAPPQETPRQFRVMAAVPRPAPLDQTATYPRDETPTRIAVFDPNEPLDGAISWR